MTQRRVRDFTGPGRPPAEVAERELRKAVVKAGIEGVRAEQDRLLAVIKAGAKKGAPVPEDLSTAAQVAARRRADLEKRMRSLERSG
jgi:DNA primase